ncbi:hypothetical protein MOPEL_009_00360 [Mobilicoccus pelagius NBRC 104925]|uniref:EVE domain-containing protein n=2 Tax=Mobilicoccus TaxID=984996 RepID=H5UNN8_9MICO|nr:hypothetical protein [Mobilicoccus pelagius]GAB47346.1 hypothetical protein MOPEL_009_00360 [Mobilicoccus pelagius NBRC 104925]
MDEMVTPTSDTPSEPTPHEAATTHWLLPIDPASHPEHLPADWRTRADATAAWEAIGRTQPIDRWCLRTGYRAMRPGDTIWAYLSKRSELVAVGTVAAIEDGDPRTVVVDWDEEATAALCRHPLPRREFGQVPMSVCRAGAETAAVLTRVRAEL